MNTEPPLLAAIPSGGELPPVVMPPPTLPKPWGFWLTLAFGLCVASAYVMVQTLVVLVAAGVRGELQDPNAIAALGLNGLVASLGIVLGAPVALGLCGVFAWLRREMRLRDYLGLNHVSWKVLAASVVGIILFNVVFVIFGYLLDRPDIPESMLQIFSTAEFAPLLWLAIILGAPLSEEVFFRGFLFKGIEYSPLGGAGAVVLTSICWALIHVQYDWYDMGVIFFMGLLLGTFRWKTGSLWPALLMHVLNNLLATIAVSWSLSEATSVSALL